jgi:hypothetical protein
MKKIMMILVVLVQTALFAQSKQTIEKPLKLTSVAVGTLADDVLVIGTDKMVKKISVASLFSGVSPQVNADWNATSGAAQILNKPVINLNQKANRGEFTGTGTNNNSLNRQVGTGGIYNDNLNQYDGTFNVNSNQASNNPNSSFNRNWQNGNQGAFNSNQLQGTTPFNYNLHQGQNAFNDNISVSNSTFERYNSPTDDYTGDLVQFQKKGVLTSRINHLGEFTTPKITITGKTANDILLGDGSTTRLKTINGASILGNGDISITANVNDATSTLKGAVKLAGDLGGTADLPTVPGLALKAPLNSPSFTGMPVVPTAIAGTSNGQAASTAFVSGFFNSKDSDIVHKTGFEDIRDTKRFLDRVIMEKGVVLGGLLAFSNLNTLNGMTVYGGGAVGSKSGHFAFASDNKAAVAISTDDVEITKNPILQVPNASGTIALTKNPTPITATELNVSMLNTAPVSASATGIAGELRFTVSGIYICTATNTWIKCVGAAF